MNYGSNVRSHLDMWSKGFGDLWEWLNSPVISMPGITLPSEFAQTTTPLSMLMTSFAVLLSLVFIFRFIKLFNILA